jgi:hypothetical protein
MTKWQTWPMHYKNTDEVWQNISKHTYIGIAAEPVCLQVNFIKYVCLR